METVEYIIAGAGYAGVFMAHQLIKENKTFKIFYDGTESASQISAGVCNPVILKRFNTFWKSKEQVAYLDHVFSEIQSYTGTNYLVRENVVRIFHNDEEKKQWLKRSQNEDLQDYLDPDFIKLGCVDNANGAGLVNHSCRINVGRFFTDMLNYLREHHYMVEEKLDYQSIDLINNQYKNLFFSKIIFCEGIASNDNPFFNTVPVQPNKGHCLRIKLAGEVDPFTIKKKHFLFDLAGTDYYYGGTYDRFDKSSDINSDSVDELRSGLQEIYKGHFVMQEVKTAFRATVADRRPILGSHRQYKNLFIFNGLGARGVYNGSYFSKVLFDYLEKDGELDPEIDVKRFYNDNN